VELSKVEVSVVKRVDLLMRKEVEDEDAKLPRRHTLGLAWHVRVGWVGCAVVGYGLITCWKFKKIKKIMMSVMSKMVKAAHTPTVGSWCVVACSCLLMGSYSGAARPVIYFFSFQKIESGARGRRSEAAPPSCNYMTV
jgi:hypothetical protein